MPGFNDGKNGDAPGTSKQEGRKQIHRRSNSQAADQQKDPNKIELLKTIKLPRNLKQLNKGLLPEKQYTEEQVPLLETIHSEQIEQQKSSLSDCKPQNKLNYESDIGHRGGGDDQRRAIEARARKYRNRQNNNPSSQRKPKDGDDDDDEPVKPSVGVSYDDEKEKQKRERRRNNHSI